MNSTITTYKELVVWQKSMQLVFLIYDMTKVFPKEEMFHLTSQIRRSAVSIPSNIAEGFLRGSRNEYRKFLLISYASGGELETQLIISKKLGYGSIDKYKEIEEIHSEVMRMLNRMTKTLSTKH